MREMKRRMQIMYSRFFISFKPPFCLKIGGRHPTTDIPYKIILNNSAYYNKIDYILSI